VCEKIGRERGGGETAKEEEDGISERNGDTQREWMGSEGMNMKEV